MANVLGLDLGRRVGWGLAGPNYLRGWKPRSQLEGPRASNAGLYYGEWTLGAEGGDVDYWYAELWNRLDDLHVASPLTVLAYEWGGTINFKSEKSAMSVIGLGVVCMTWARVHGVKAHRVKNNQLKKHAAGHGHAEKDRIDEAARRLGWEPQTPNVADGLFVLDYCLTEWHRS